MLHEFKLPSLGDGVSGKILEILVKTGDKVSKEQIVLVVGTDKVDAEIPADADGTVAEILVKKGQDVTDGTVILKLETAAAAPAEAPATAKSAAPEVAKTAATPEPAPAAQPVEKQAVEAQTAAQPAPAEPEKSSEGLRVSPLARKRAKELGIALSDVHATAGSSRISKEDVLNFAKKMMENSNGAASPSGNSTASVARKPLPNFEKFGAVERQPQSRIGQIVAENMVYNFNQTIPHAWISEKADITQLENLRQQHKESVKTAGGNLTTTAIIAKAVAQVLKKMPLFNSSLDEAKQEIVLKKFINIGIAVDTPKGLMVPVLRETDKKGLIEIAIELTNLSTRTRDGKNKPDDMDGGTFTISNIGGIGGTNMISIVNWPQVAILSIVAARMEPVWNEKTATFEPRLMMPMTIGWDHRVIGGADAARFLVELKKILEDPFLLVF